MTTFCNLACGGTGSDILVAMPPLAGLRLRQTGVRASPLLYANVRMVTGDARHAEGDRQLADSVPSL
jgi:hypothetical protein